MTGLGPPLLVLGGLLVGMELVAALLALLRRRLVLPRRAAPPPGPAFAPRCVVIVPTKGAAPSLARSLQAYARQSYAAHQVIFAVEDEHDPGVPTIRKIVAAYPHCRLVTARHSAHCSQQNHNMLAGVAAASDAELLVFGDNDIAPSPSWLAHLVAPLADPRVAVATAYRWIVPSSGTWAQHFHVFTNMTMYAYLSFGNALFRRGLWGGSFALRRLDYERLGVGARWAETISDDLSLMEILDRSELETTLVAELPIEILDDSATLRDGFAWLRRQVLNTKAYSRPLWRFVLFCASGGLACYAASAWLIFRGLTSASDWTGVAFGAPFLGCELLTACLYGGGGPTRRHGWMVACAPVLRVLQGLACLSTVGASHITWAGIRYRFDARGRVIEIQRPNPAG